MNSRPISVKVHLAALLAAAALLGCGAKKPEEHLQAAMTAMAKADMKTAAIEAKNAIQLNSEFGEARFVLGKVVLAEGNFAAAEVEFRKAIAVKFPQDQVVPELARAMLMSGKAKNLTDEFGGVRLDSPTANADLQTSLASAYAAQAKQDLAEQAIKSALAADPGHEPAQIAAAGQKLVTNDPAGALRMIDQVLAKAPKNADAWRLKGDVHLFGDRNSDEALVAYRKSIEVDSKLIPAHVGILTVLIQQGQVDEAAKQVEQLKKHAPQSSQTRYYEAQVAYLKQNFKQAREIAQQLIRVSPNNPLGLQLAGAIELQLNSLVQAEIYLSRATAAAPNLLLARQLLVTTYLRSGQTAKALEALNAVTGKAGLDPRLFSLAGQVHLQNGDSKSAEEYFAKALKLDPNNSTKRTAVAITQLATGQTERALDELQSIAKADTGTTADLALISSHLRRKDLARALLAIDKLEAKQSGKPFAANLRGRVYLEQRDFANARKSFEQAVMIDPSYFAAVAGLATMDVADKKPEDAKKRFEALLAKNPKHSQALLALAQLAINTGADKDYVAGLLSKAIDADPAEANARLLLIEHLARNKDIKQALAVAQRGVAAAPNSPEMLDALGRVQLSSGDLNQAIATYSKLTGLQPLSAQAHMRLAEVHFANKDDAAAERSLRKVLELKPDALNAQATLIAKAIKNRNFPEATKISRTVQQQRPKSEVGFAMEGDVAASQENWDAAASAYRAGLKQAPSSVQLATKLHAVMMASNKTAEADRYASTWMRDHPRDVAFLLYLSDTSLARKDFAAAEKFYAATLQIQPNNAIALNNLAWVTGQLGKPGAIAYAEKAISLEPKQAAFKDTLAMLLAEAKNFARAVEVQNEVLALAPANHGYRLNLAKIHIKAGDKSRARVELETLAKLGEKFSGQSEVSSLMKSL
jgi:cellulose synthase operon protein C